MESETSGVRVPGATLFIGVGFRMQDTEIICDYAQQP
jgi:hypothetical protein